MIPVTLRGNGMRKRAKPAFRVLALRVAEVAVCGVLAGDVEAVVLEVDQDGYVVKITNTNADGPFFIQEFEYAPLGKSGSAPKTGFAKYQQFTAIDKAVMNCY